MRKFLVNLLMLLMITPGLACGGIMCTPKAHAAQSMQGMPCHGHMDSKQDQFKDVMLFKDCMKVDLSKVDHSTVQKPDLTGKVFHVALADTQAVYNFSPVNQNSIRGPPPDWPGLSQTKPSILLSTLRFRE